MISGLRLGVVGILLLNIAGALEYNGTVYLRDGILQIKRGVVDVEGLSYGVFRDDLMETGWGVLDIKTSAKGQSFEDLSNVMRAAGYLEGYLTHKNIYNTYQNTKGYFMNQLSEEALHKLKQYITAQEPFMSNGRSLHQNDQLWDAFGLVYSQYEGLKEGYNAAASHDQQLDDFAFVILNWSGDLLDLIPHFEPKQRPDINKMTKMEVNRYLRKKSHCSVLIKLLAGYENLFFSHSTWYIYEATDRIYKYYDLDIPFAASKKMSFSSYPGYLESFDDFYMMENGLIMLQTTIPVMNVSLYDQLSSQTMPAWMRVRAANMLARNASHWGKLIKPYNSGTYNNQYMILDMNKVKINETIEDEAFYVVEQIPGLVISEEQTDMLRNGHWISYNKPFYESVYNLSGYPLYVQKHGADFSYQLAPRAKIFRRDAGKVHDLESMKRMMRFNDYKNDPYSEKDACKTICCRSDIGEDPDTFGCTDSKISDFNMAAEQRLLAINGPTLGVNDSIPPFNWSQIKNSSHQGLPQSYSYQWTKLGPLL